MVPPVNLLSYPRPVLLLYRTPLLFVVLGKQLSFSSCVPRTGQYFSLWPWPRSRRGPQIRDVSPPLFQLHGPCISMFRSSIQLEVFCARPEVGTRLHFPPGGYSTNSLYSQWLEVLCLSYPRPHTAPALTRNSWGHSHVTALAWPSRITPSEMLSCREHGATLQPCSFSEISGLLSHAYSSG